MLIDQSIKLEVTKGINWTFPALSLEPSENSPHHTAAAPLVGLSRRGGAVPKKEVAPPTRGWIVV